MILVSLGDAAEKSDGLVVQMCGYIVYYVTERWRISKVDDPSSYWRLQTEPRSFGDSPVCRLYTYVDKIEF